MEAVVKRTNSIRALIPAEGSRAGIALQRLNKLVSLLRLLGFLKLLLAVYRHVRARGLIRSGTETYGTIRGVGIHAHHDIVGEEASSYLAACLQGVAVPAVVEEGDPLGDIQDQDSAKVEARAIVLSRGHQPYSHADVA